MEDIKPGYKKTDIGVIPKDWEMKTIGKLGLFSKGNGISRAESNTGIIPCVRYGEIYTTHDNYIKKFYSFISREVANRAKKLKVGDVLFTASGETKEDIGKNVAFIDNIEAYAGGDIIILSPKNADSLFLGYLFNAPYVVTQKANKGQGDAVVHITKDSLRDIVIAIPESISEQTAIATALSDTDALIAALDKKIAKKQQIKQGAMQQLLTGKKRLPGFSGEWVEKKLRDVAQNIKTGKRNGEDNDLNGKYPFFVRSKNVLRLNSYSFDGEAILIPGEGGIGTIFHYINGKFDYHQRVYKISNFVDESDGKFIFYYLKYFFGNYALQNSVKATVDSLRLATFEEFLMTIPNTKHEQTAIAQILTDMDNEIAQLEKEGDKYKEIKAGMMQVLLTGRVRLM